MSRRWSMALLTAAVLASAPSRADEIEAFYAGKKLDFIIGAAAGGGYGIYAAVLAKHIGKHIPGQPQVISRIMDGAGSLTAANQLYTRSAKDGTAFGAVFTGAVVEPLIGDRAKARYDSREFGWIGSANRETIVCFARTELGIKTWDDVMTNKLIVGGAGWTSSIRQYPAVLQKVLGMQFEVIPGYPGSKEAMQAVERNEVQGTCGIQWSSFAPTFGKWVTDGTVRVFGQIAAPPGDPLMNSMGVQNLWDVVKDEGKKQVLEVIFNQMEFGRPYVMPPGVPAARLAALRAAFDATMKDPEFLADAERAQLPISPMSGLYMQKEVERLYTVPEKFVNEARQVLE